MENKLRGVGERIDSLTESGGKVDKTVEVMISHAR